MCKAGVVPASVSASAPAPAPAPSPSSSSSSHVLILCLAIRKSSIWTEPNPETAAKRSKWFGLVWFAFSFFVNGSVRFGGFTGSVRAFFRY